MAINEINYVIVVNNITKACILFCIL